MVGSSATRFFLRLLIASVLLSGFGAGIGQAETPLINTTIIEWQQLLGGQSDEEGWAVQQIADGGYILLGSSYSSANGDVTNENHGDRDIWVVKLHSSGMIQWDKLLGGNHTERAGHGLLGSIQQTVDGGYILLGESWSSASGDVAGVNHGNGDFWVVKLDGMGTIQWEKLLGGSNWEAGHSVLQTADGGFILLGESTSSSSGNVTGSNHGNSDIWVVKLDSAGTIQWQRLLGGNDSEHGHSVHKTTDGGYIVLGTSYSSQRGDVTGTKSGSSDLWVVKLDGAGTIQWERLLGGTGKDDGSSIQQTTDGGYILLGTSASSASGNVTGTNHNWGDFWVVKMDTTGAIEWQRLLGGNYHDSGYSVQQTTDGGYILLGSSDSNKNGDVANASHGNYDQWIVKVDNTGTILWQRLLGGSGVESGASVRQTADGSYILFGSSSSTASGDVTGITHGGSDFWVAKLKEVTVPLFTFPGETTSPLDLNFDGKYEDVNGNGRKDFADIVLFFNQMAWITANEPILAFDYNENNRTDFADVVWLFNTLDRPAPTPTPPPTPPTTVPTPFKSATPSVTIPTLPLW